MDKVIRDIWIIDQTILLFSLLTWTIARRQCFHKQEIMVDDMNFSTVRLVSKHL
jgi:hypothetical protein